jgi:amino acid transporter
MPIVLAFWAGGYAWKRTGWLKLEQIDVDTGRRDLNWDEIHAYRAHVASLPSWKRVYYHLFQ